MSGLVGALPAARAVARGTPTNTAQSASTNTAQPVRSTPPSVAWPESTTQPAADAPDQAAHSQRDTRLAEALRAFDAKEYQSAQRAFDALAREAPDDPDAASLAFNAAVCSYALGAFSDAERRFVALGARWPALRDLAQVNAGFAALRAGNLAAARAHLPSAPLGDADAEAQRTELAQEIAEHERRARRDALLTDLDAGYAALDLGDLPLAEQRLRRALAFEDVATPRELRDLRYALALLYEERAELELAAEQLRVLLSRHPEDAQALHAAGQIAEGRGDDPGAEQHYSRAIALETDPAQRARIERDLFGLYPLPRGGPSAGVFVGLGFDDNATQSGTAELLGTSSGGRIESAFASSMLDLGFDFRTQKTLALGPYYAGDLLALFAEEAEGSSLQAHELGGRVQWAPNPATRLRLLLGATAVLSGLRSIEPFTREALLGVRLDVASGRHANTRLDVQGRLIWGAAELPYLDGKRLDAQVRHSLTFAELELWAAAGFRFNAAGVQSWGLVPNAYAVCTPRCDFLSYLVPQSYLAQTLELGAAYRPYAPLRLSIGARAEHRRYLDASRIERIPLSSKTREDWRFRPRAGAELELDERGRMRLSFDHVLLVSRSNVAFDPNDPEHALDYDDRNFVQNVSELGFYVGF